MQENLNTSFALSISHSSFLPCLCPIFSAQNASPCPFITLFMYFKSNLHSQVLQKFFLHISPRWYDVLFFPANPHNTCHLSYCLAALPSITVIRLDIAYQTRGFLRADTLYHSPSSLLLSLAYSTCVVHTLELNGIEPTSRYTTNGSLQKWLAGCAAPAPTGVSKNTVTLHGWLIIFPKGEGGFGAIWPVKIETILWREIEPSFPHQDCWWHHPTLCEHLWLHI